MTVLSALSRLFRGVASILQDLFQTGVFSPHHALFQIDYWREGCGRENQRTALPGGGLGVDGSGDGGQAGLRAAALPWALHRPPGQGGGPLERWGSQDAPLRVQTRGGSFCWSPLLLTREWGGPRWGSEGQQACPSRGPLGCTATVPLLRTGPAAAALGAVRS